MTNDRPEILFVGSREVREFPKGWQHPRDARGNPIALIPADAVEGDAELIGWEGLMPDTRGLPHEETEIAAYENVSEGTPISPAFPNTPEGKLDLVRYCAEHCTTFGDHRTSVEAWAAILFGDAAITSDGRVVAKG